MLSYRLAFFLAALTLTGLIGCDATAPTDDDPVAGLDGLTVPDGFDYATTTAVEVRVQALGNTGAPLAGVPVDFLDATGRRLSTGITPPDGTLVQTLAVPTDLDTIVAAPRYVGLPSELVLKISGGVASGMVGGPPPPPGPAFVRSGAARMAGVTAGLADGYATLGGWNADGVPDYLEPTRDAIDAGLLATLNASLPENSPVPTSHPEYLASGNETDVTLREAADVWVTFVHEGAGWRNALGYYTYDASAPPSSVDEIAAPTIVFPNVSFAGSGGGLYAGDKVHLGRFPAGTAIGWFVVSNGWTGSGVTGGPYTVYSNPAFNPESDPDRRQHNVLLRDSERDLLLLAFEDVSRDHTPFHSDEDFNDAVFYVTTNPPSAIGAAVVPAVTDPGSDPSADGDGDGVLNALDAEPYVSGIASYLHLPAEGADGSVAFEDLWPSRGDYDFNDLVADYHMTVGLNADGRATRLDAQITVRAIGAGFQNALALALPIQTASVRSVTGAVLGRNVFAVDPNGTEGGQSRAVIPLVDNAYALVQRPSGFFVNTQPEAPSVTPGQLTVRIEFSYPIPLETLRLSEVDLFLVVNGERGREVHLPGRQPTAKAHTGHFGTNADATEPGTERTYMTAEGLPWALHLPEAFAYPVENAPLDTGHLKFVPWARSGGSTSPDWYRNLPGHRDAAHIYAR